MLTLVPSDSDNSVLERGDVGLRLGLVAVGLPAAGGQLAGGELLRAMFDLAHRPAVFGGIGSQLAGEFRRQRQQRARMAHFQAPRFEQGADRGRQFQQAQQVGDRRARAADRFGRLRMGQVELVDQAMQRLRFLERVEVFALDVLDQRHRDHGAVVDDAHHRRDLGQSGLQRRAPAAFAGDDLVGLAAAAGAPASAGSRAPRSAGSRPARGSTRPAR